MQIKDPDIFHVEELLSGLESQRSLEQGLYVVHNPLSGFFGFLQGQRRMLQPCRGLSAGLLAVRVPEGWSGRSPQRSCVSSCARQV